MIFQDGAKLAALYEVIDLNVGVKSSSYIWSIFLKFMKSYLFFNKISEALTYFSDTSLLHFCRLMPFLNLMTKILDIFLVVWYCFWPLYNSFTIKFWYVFLLLIIAFHNLQIYRVYIEYVKILCSNFLLFI